MFSALLSFHSQVALRLETFSAEIAVLDLQERFLPNEIVGTEPYTLDHLTFWPSSNEVERLQSTNSLAHTDIEMGNAQLGSKFLRSYYTDDKILFPSDFNMKRI